MLSELGIQTDDEIARALSNALPKRVCVRAAAAAAPFGKTGTEGLGEHGPKKETRNKRGSPELNRWAFRKRSSRSPTNKGPNAGPSSTTTTWPKEALNERSAVTDSTKANTNGVNRGTVTAATLTPSTSGKNGDVASTSQEGDSVLSSSLFNPAPHTSSASSLPYNMPLQAFEGSSGNWLPTPATDSEREQAAPNPAIRINWKTTVMTPSISQAQTPVLSYPTLGTSPEHWIPGHSEAASQASPSAERELRLRKVSTANHPVKDSVIASQVDSIPPATIPSIAQVDSQPSVDAAYGETSKAQESCESFPIPVAPQEGSQTSLVWSNRIPKRKRTKTWIGSTPAAELDPNNIIGGGRRTRARLSNSGPLNQAAPRPDETSAEDSPLLDTHTKTQRPGKRRASPRDIKIDIAQAERDGQTTAETLKTAADVCQRPEALENDLDRSEPPCRSTERPLYNQNAKPEVAGRSVIQAKRTLEHADTLTTASTPQQRQTSDPDARALEHGSELTPPASALTLVRPTIDPQLEIENEEAVDLSAQGCRKQKRQYTRHAKTAPEVRADAATLRPPTRTPKAIKANKPPIVEPEINEAVIEKELDQSLNPNLVRVAHVLHRNAAKARSTPREEKPDPFGQPPVWAKCRQNLCETVPYYRSYNGSGYCKEGVAYSFMFDGGRSRDYTDSQVIIQSAGGGKSVNAETGAREADRDNTDSAQIKCVQANIDKMNTVMIIAGANNITMESKMPHTYQVLGWFKPTHVWHERDPKTGVKVTRYRFEKHGLDNDSWWRPKNSEDVVAPGEFGPEHSEMCAVCHRRSPQVYLQGWMCLYEQCSVFWHFKSGQQPNQQHLRYDPRFLKQKTDWPYVTHSHPVIPPLPESCDDSAHVSRIAARGVVCRKCGRCVEREDFRNGWRCENCGWTHALTPKTVPPSVHRELAMPVSEGFPLNLDRYEDPITLKTFFEGNHRVSIYIVPDVGFIAHLATNLQDMEHSHGADDVFRVVQEADLGLKRRVMANTTSPGSRMSSFTGNFGMMYKFVAPTESRSFESCPDEVITAKRRMQWAADLVAKLAGSQPSEEKFNEMLALAYMEGQSINYHDDGEKGLGPIIATESYGAPGSMLLRLKEKHWKGLSKTDSALLVDKRPLPDVPHYKLRLNMWEELEQMRAHSSSSEVRQKRKEFAQTLHNEYKRNKSTTTGRQKGSREEADVPEPDAEDAEVERTVPKKRGMPRFAPPILDMKVLHGDIIIMSGERLQEYFEHSVSHEGKLRIALTCRHIRQGHLKPEEQPLYEVKDDPVQYFPPRFNL